MLSANMTENNESRIEFPNKNPDEWKMFYPFIDPFQIGEAKHASINDENVMTLVPWFHEFQLGSLHQQCDQFLLDKVLSLARAEKVDNCWGFTLDYSFWDRDMILNSNSSRIFCSAFFPTRGRATADAPITLRHCISTNTFWKAPRTGGFAGGA